MKFKFQHQHDLMDCGPACLSMIASYYGKNYSLNFLKENSFITKEGISLRGIREASTKLGFEVISSKQTLDDVIELKNYLPCIIHWNQNHFVVLRKITKNFFNKKEYFHIADPAHGLIKLTKENFKNSWIPNGNIEGIVLYLKPKKSFYEKQPEEDNNKITLFIILKKLIPYKRKLAFMFLLLMLGSTLNLILPFLTEKLIDDGVNVKNISLIKLILLTQLFIFLGTITIDVIRNWITLTIGTNLSIKIISDFIKKILQLPIKFFDTKKKGDFMQRIQDNERIEEFLTSESITTFFSIITFTVFFGVFFYYDFKIFIVYFFLTLLSVFWSLFWLKKRKTLDYFRFQQRSEDQESIFEIINGVTEMKLNQFEDYKRLEWERLQSKILKLNIRILKVEQIQISGFEFINQIKNIVVTFISATYVVQGKMSLGVLLSISYIIGQMNSPISQLIRFFRSFQDAKLSFERLNEVDSFSNEVEADQELLVIKSKFSKEKFIDGIKFENLSFRYGGDFMPYILKNINIFIPHGKVTAIVGASGSGKTTLMKLLLKFYDPNEGGIYFNDKSLVRLSASSIRENSGVVMQNGYIFSDTIERNIATGDEIIDQHKLEQSIEISNLKEFVNNLPLKSKTKIGAEGNDISGGQRQRILIARAIYKNPQYLFLDEATSALDAENEKIIHDNLQSFFNGKTVVIIAHRLSTVKKANQIIVLKKGEIIENGNHKDLVKKKSEYYNLVKNQLELGN